MSALIRAAVTSTRGLEHADVLDDVSLLRKLVGRLGRGEANAPRWSHVGAALGHGSGVSQAICRALDLDPDELIGSRRRS